MSPGPGKLRARGRRSRPFSIESSVLLASELSAGAVAATSYQLTKVRRLNRLLQHFQPETARKWLAGTNAHLGNARPLDLIARNRFAEVIAAIEQADLDSYA